MELLQPRKKLSDNSKVGLSIRLNQKDEDEPFEATLFFSKNGKDANELREKDAINLTASGKLRLDIGDNGFVEIFAEKSGRLKNAESSETEIPSIPEEPLFDEEVS
jgi:hypothetical protein